MSLIDNERNDDKRNDDRAKTQSSSRYIVALLIGLVSLGVLVRSTRYLPAWAAWSDETAVALNIGQRGYAELLQPLDHVQVAPIGFLWSTKLATDLFGFHELSLRLVPFLCSILACVLIAIPARDLARGWAVVFAVGILCVSTYQVRHSAEIKPYAVDCLVTTLLVMMVLRVGLRQSGAAWVLVALVPVSLFFSLPAVFVAGGIGLALLPDMIQRRSVKWWSWYVVYGLVVVSSFLLLYIWVLKPQLSTHSIAMTNHWANSFPVFTRPVELMTWLLETATGSIFAHPFGGEHAGSLPFAILFWIGLVTLWKMRQRMFVRVVAGTFLLAFIAAAMRKYPMGGHARIGQYLAPLVVIPVAMGATSLVFWRTNDHSQVRRRALAVVVFLVAIGTGVIVKNLAQPFVNPITLHMDTFGRWFWTDYAETAPGPIMLVSQVRGGDIPFDRLQHFDYLQLRFSQRPVKKVQPVPSDLNGPVGLTVCLRERGSHVEEILQNWRDTLAEQFDVFQHNSFVVGPDHPRPARYEVVWIRPMAESSASDHTTLGDAARSASLRRGKKF